MHQKAFVGRAVFGSDGELTALPTDPSCIKKEDGKGQTRGGRGIGEEEKEARKEKEGKEEQGIGPPFYET